MRTVLLALSLALSLALAACAHARENKNELPPPTPPAPLDGRQQAACAALERAGCPEARPKTGTCAGDLAQAEGYREHVDYACLSAATTPEAVRACGGRGKLTVECRR